MANSSSSQFDIYCLLGPTASGKTEMVIELANRYPFEIINVDSAQIYRGMDIGTAKPDKQILQLTPHHLIDIRDPSEVYSAADFRRDALNEISTIICAGKVPLLVGGTMLYFKVLREGLSDMPQAHNEIRAQIDKIALNLGWGHVHKWLAMVDPESADRIHPNDPQRIQRALEVFLISGKSLTELHSQGDSNTEKVDFVEPYNFHFFGIQPDDRAVLHNRIAERFNKMLEMGFVDEVRTLYDREELHEGLPSIKSVGYRQIWRHLSDEITYKQMVEQSLAATRQLAKRQLTWLRRWKNLKALGNTSTKSIDYILNYVQTTSI